MAESDIVPPIMPTELGVVDLEVARELDALISEEVAPPERTPLDDAAGGLQADPASESEAHPS